MTELVSLRKMCEEVGVSRRTIQGYEKVGVIKSESKNKYGHLLYSKKMVEKAKKVKFFRDIGFNNAEISQIIDSPESIMVNLINEKINFLENEVERIKLLIDKAQQLICELKECSYEKNEKS